MGKLAIATCLHVNVCTLGSGTAAFPETAKLANLNRSSFPIGQLLFVSSMRCFPASLARAGEVGLHMCANCHGMWSCHLQFFAWHQVLHGSKFW